MSPPAAEGSQAWSETSPSVHGAVSLQNPIYLGRTVWSFLLLDTDDARGQPADVSGVKNPLWQCCCCCRQEGGKAGTTHRISQFYFYDFVFINWWAEGSWAGHGETSRSEILIYDTVLIAAHRTK